MENYHFSNEQINLACQQVEKTLVSYGVERREAIRIKATAGNVSGWQLTLIEVADSLDMIDQKVLHEGDPNTNGIEH